MPPQSANLTNADLDGSKRPLVSTTSSSCGDSSPITFRTEHLKLYLCSFAIDQETQVDWIASGKYVRIAKMVPQEIIIGKFCVLTTT
ncbi:hypothetical protein BpHYR1_027673 [Brachionus plicatilis]|uniref:Uncharacterized protein n=1 Tax=Brachionus plicatilis TaxID=10195 RepID=A0A3M7QD94_BRAPC|nr:hypothetical protein BpHYR1_027673 [Brachionus plicatilis]